MFLFCIPDYMNKIWQKQIKSYLNQVLSVSTNMAMLLWNIFWISVLKMILFSQSPHNSIIWKKIFLPAFLNILTEPLLVQKQMIPQQKALILSFLQMESLREWHYQEGYMPLLAAKRHWKKSKFNGAKSGRKINFFSI